MERDFIETLYNNGAEVFLIGGAVRNIVHNMLNADTLSIKDRDLVVRLLDEKTLVSILEKYGSVKHVGKSFGVYKFKPKDKLDNIDSEIDIALPRIEIGEDIKYDKDIELEKDCERRDATINCLAIKVKNTKDLCKMEFKLDDIIDYKNGVADISNKIWRAVGDPVQRFKEDPVRMMRGIRQCSELGYDLDADTKSAISESKNLLEPILKNSPVRVTDEIVRTLKGVGCEKMLNYIFTCGLNRLLKLEKNNSGYISNTKNIRTKMALFLYAHENKKCYNWCKKHELGASLYYNVKDIEFINCVCDLFEDMEDIYNFEGTTKQLDIKFKELLQNVDKISKGSAHSYIVDMIEYHNIVGNVRDNILMTIYNRNSNVIFNIDQVDLNGHIMMEKWGVEGGDIKKLKNELFVKITQGKLENKMVKLIAYCDAKFKKK